MNDDDRKYLDPEENPFIPKWDDDVELPADEPGADGRAPMMDLSLTADALVEKISQAFPGQDELEIGKTVLVRMATGTYTVKETGQKISDLGLADLMKLADFLKDRQKG